MTGAELIQRYATIRKNLMGTPRKPVIVRVKPEPAPPPPPVRIKREIRLQTRPITAAEILRRVARWHGVTVEEIISPTRNRRITRARFAVFYWIRRRTNMSLVSTSRMIGDRDHTCVVNGVRQHVKFRAERKRK